MNRFLKAKIIEKFGTQTDFAQALNIDETYVSRIVRGRRKLPEEVKAEWARTLGCSKKIFHNEKAQETAATVS